MKILCLILSALLAGCEKSEGPPVSTATTAEASPVSVGETRSPVAVVVEQPSPTMPPVLATPELVAPVEVSAISLGGIKAGQVTGMTMSGPNSWKSVPNWQNIGNQIVMVRYVTKATYGQTIEETYTVQGYLDWGVKDSTGKYIANLKIHRLWPSSGNYVNIYEGQSPGGQECHLYGENLKIKAGTAWRDTHPPMNYALVKKMFDGQPHKVSRIMKLPSGRGMNDGRYTVTVDGATAIDLKNWQVNDDAHPAIPNVVNLQVDISNHKQPASAYVNFSDVVVRVR